MQDNHQIIVEDSHTNCFKNFIEKYENKNNRFGDLARDIVDDDNFPETDSFIMILSYLNRMHACIECKETFKDAYIKYIRQLYNEFS